jgi:hypothetical protein
MPETLAVGSIEVESEAHGVAVSQGNMSSIMTPNLEA